jgi:putative phage-type endonuclease
MLLDITQGTEEWKALRKTKITGTDASIILGLNPYKSEDKLLRQKLNLDIEDEVNEAMAIGQQLEPIARDIFCRQTKEWYVPSVHIHDIEDWMMCSTDGITLDGSTILEIKCGKSAYEKLKNDEIPSYYMAQIQHNLYVSGACICNFMTYWDSNWIYKKVLRDEEFIGQLIDKEREFYNRLQTESVDYTDNEAWSEIEDALIKSKMEYEIAKLKFEETKKDAISLITGNSAIGNKIRITKRKGRPIIDYKSIPELANVDLSKYTTYSSSYWHTEFLNER